MEKKCLVALLVICLAVVIAACAPAATPTVPGGAGTELPTLPGETGTPMFEATTAPGVTGSPEVTPTPTGTI